MSRNRMKIRHYRERCGVLADLGELLQEISGPGAHPTPRPSGTIKATDIRNPLEARSPRRRRTILLFADLPSARRSPTRTAAGTPDRSSRSSEPPSDNGTRNRMERCPNTVSPRMTEPTLCKRGSFRQDYAGSTLRDHYGSTRPVNVFSRSLQAIASSIKDRSRRTRRALLCSANEQFVRSPTHSGFAAIESDQFASPKCQPCFREQQESAAIEHIWDPSISSRAPVRTPR